MKMSMDDAKALAMMIMKKTNADDSVVEDMPGHFVDEDFLSAEEDTPGMHLGMPDPQDNEPILARVMRKHRNKMK